MEFCANGDLMDYLTCHPDLAMPERVRILRECASGMKYLHSKNIMHRDLKPQNVLLDESYHAKLIDFGLSRTMDATGQLKTQRVGTSHYMAPEIATTGDYDYRVDIFSYAIMSFEILNQTFSPFGGQSEFGIELRIASDPNLRPDWETVTPETDTVEKLIVPEQLKAIITLAWDDDPDCRPSFEQIVAVMKGELEYAVVEQAMSEVRLRKAPPKKTETEQQGEEEEDVVKIELPEFGPEEIVFDRIPTSQQEFDELREIYETQLEEDESLPDSLRRYRRATIGVAFYALALLVYAREGEDVGTRCISQCCADRMLLGGSRVLADKHLDYFAKLKKHSYLAMSYLSPPEGSSILPPSAKNDYAYDLDSGASFRVLPDGEYGGLQALPSNPIAQCLRVGCCTFKKTGPDAKSFTQRWFKCKTCKELSPGTRLGCCEVCAEACHRALGHTVVEATKSPIKAFCDCGEGIAMHDVGDGKEIRCSFLKLSFPEAVENFLDTEIHSSRPFPFSLRLVCNGTSHPKSVTVLPCESRGNLYVVGMPLLLDPDIAFPSLPRIQEVVSEPQKVHFNKVPSSVQEFSDLRSEMEKQLSDENFSPDTLAYRLACLGAAFYALSLLVYACEGPEDGIACVTSCCHSTMLVGGAELHPRTSQLLIPLNEKKFYAVSYVCPPDGSSVPVPSPKNQYEYDFESGIGFDFQIGPENEAHGGRVITLRAQHEIQQVRCCSYHITGRQLVTQRFFRCLTCEGMSQGKGCCYYCAQQCHASLGHRVFEAKKSPCRAWCDCGEQKEMVEEDSRKPVHCRMITRSLERARAGYIKENEFSVPYALSIVSHGRDQPVPLRLFRAPDSNKWLVKQIELLNIDIQEPMLAVSSLDDDFPELHTQGDESPPLVTNTQFVSGVLDFSSENGERYAAAQLIGPPKVHPAEGHQPGAWAHRLPLKCDFVECEFQRPSLAKQIRIFETHKAGAITGVYVRRSLWSGEPVGRWILLYSAAAASPGASSRVLEVEVPRAKIPLVVRFVRLELNTTVLGRFSDIDTIALVGEVPCAASPSQALADPQLLFQAVESVVEASSEWSGSFQSGNVVGKMEADRTKAWWSGSESKPDGHFIITKYRTTVYPRQVKISWPYRKHGGYTFVPLLRVLSQTPNQDWVVGWEGEVGPMGDHELTLSCTHPTSTLKLEFADKGYAAVQLIVLVGIPAHAEGICEFVEVEDEGESTIPGDAQPTPADEVAPDSPDASVGDPEEPPLVGETLIVTEDPPQRESEDEDGGEIDEGDLILQPVHEVASVSSTYSSGWTAENVVGKLEPIRKGWWSSGCEGEIPHIEVLYEFSVLPVRLDIGWPKVPWSSYPRIPLCRIFLESTEDQSMVLVFNGEIDPKGNHSIPIDREFRRKTNRVRLEYEKNPGAKYAVMEKIVLVGKQCS